MADDADGPDSRDDEGPDECPEEDGTTAGLDEVADELYALPPDDFVPARDDRVAAARAAGDRELAKAIARLRRPTKAAWLANLLARHRAEQLDGLVALARSLADAQRTLDGDQLRALSGQRNKVVAAMAREAGRLARQQGEPVSDTLLRELQGILEAAMAQPDVAEEVRAGRLTKTVTWSGFGPDGDDADMAAWAASAPPRDRPARRAAAAPAEEPADDDAGTRAAAERAAAQERERRAAERAERQRALDEAEDEEAAARERQEADEAARDDADERHEAARSRVAELSAALEEARAEEQAAVESLKQASAAARTSAREAAAAAARTERARARLERVDDEAG